MKVAVVGGGLAGSLAAWHIAKAGAHVSVFEQAGEPGGGTVCGGVALAPALHQAMPAWKLPSITITNVAIVGREWERELKLPPALYLSTDRKQVDARLLEEAADAGARLHLSTTVLSVLPDGLVRWAGGKAEKFDLVVVADGHPSVWRFNTPRTSPLPFCVACLADLPGLDHKNWPHAVFWLDQPTPLPGYSWLFLKPSGIQVGCGALAPASSDLLRKQMNVVLEKAAVPERLKSKVRFKCATIPLRLAGNWGQGRVAVLGDAAGLVNPFTGGGIVYAVASALTVASAVKQALNSNALDPGLRTAALYRKLISTSPHTLWLRFVGLAFRKTLAKHRGGRKLDMEVVLRRYLMLTWRLSRLASWIQARWGHPHRRKVNPDGVQQ